MLAEHEVYVNVNLLQNLVWRRKRRSSPIRSRATSKIYAFNPVSHSVTLILLVYRKGRFY